MPIEIGPIAKPFIQLIGERVSSSGTLMGRFSDRVEHAKHINPLYTLSINSITQFDQDLYDINT